MTYTAHGQAVLFAAQGQAVQGQNAVGGPLVSAHAFSVTGCCARLFLSETMSRGIMRAEELYAALPHTAQVQTPTNSTLSPFRQSRELGWGGHAVEHSNLEQKNQLEKLLGSGRHKFWGIYFKNTSEGRLRSFGRNSKGHFSVYCATISCFNYWFPAHCNLAFPCRKWPPEMWFLSIIHKLCAFFPPSNHLTLMVSIYRFLR